MGRTGPAFINSSCHTFAGAGAKLAGWPELNGVFRDSSNTQVVVVIEELAVFLKLFPTEA